MSQITDEQIAEALRATMPRTKCTSGYIWFARTVLALQPSASAEPVQPDLKDVWLTAPKRVWLDIDQPDNRELDVYEGKNFRDLDEVTWSEDNATGWGIPYLRADLSLKEHVAAITSESFGEPVDAARVREEAPSAWEAFRQTEQYQNLARWAGIKVCGGFTEDDMRQAFQAGERYGQDRCPAGTPQSGESACEHCGGTGQIFGHADNCDDDLCALNGDQHSCAGKMEPCSCSAPTAPDIPPGCEMARGWAVEVSAQGERVLLLSDVGYSGMADIEPWASTIRGCAEHLQAFIGPAEGGASFDPDAPLETGEADAKEPSRCAVAGCRYALDGQGLAAKCLPGCSIAKEGGKK